MIHDWRLLPSVITVWFTIWVLAQPREPQQLVVWSLACALGWLVLSVVAISAVAKKRLSRHHPQSDRGWWAAESTRATAGLACLCGAAASIIAGFQLMGPAQFVAQHEGDQIEIELLIEDAGSPVRKGATRYVARILGEQQPDFPRGAVWLIIPQQIQIDSSATVPPRFGHEFSDGDRTAVTASLRAPWGNKLAELHVAEYSRIIHHGATSRAALMRQSLEQASSHLPDFSRGLIPGIAVGNDHALPHTWNQELRTVSLTHITAVSGAHIALMVGLVSAAVLWAPRIIQMLASLAAIVALIWLVQGEPSVIRAATMGVVVALGRGSGRGSVASAALCASAIVLLFAEPHLAREWGFALSLAATWGLIWLQPVVVRRLFPLPPVIAEIVAVPIAAQLACLPLLLLLDPVIPLYSVPANVLAALTVPLVTVSALAAAPMVISSDTLWSQCGELLLWIAHLGCAWIAAVAEFFANLPGAQLPWGYGLVVIALLLAKRFSTTTAPDPAPTQVPVQAPAQARSSPVPHIRIVNLQLHGEVKRR